MYHVSRHARGGIRIGSIICFMDDAKQNNNNLRYMDASCIVQGVIKSLHMVVPYMFPYIIHNTKV